MPITRTAIQDDDGSGKTGTVIDNAWKQELYNQIDAAGLAGLQAALRPINPFVLGPHSDLAQTGATIHNWPLPATNFVFVSGTPGLLTGIVEPPDSGTVKIFVSLGSSMTFKHQDAGSATRNRFFGVGYADTVLGSWKSQTMFYSTGIGGWVLLT